VQHGAKDECGEALTMETLLNEETVVPTGSRRRKGWSKQTLYALAQELKPQPQYLIHEWTKACNEAHGSDVTVLVLPVAHPILNPIELMWSQLKKYVRQNNHDFDMTKIRRLVMEKIDTLGRDAWKAVYDHSRKYAVDQWVVDEQSLEEEEAAEEPPPEE